MSCKRWHYGIASRLLSAGYCRSEFVRNLLAVRLRDLATELKPPKLAVLSEAVAHVDVDAVGSMVATRRRLGYERSRASVVASCHYTM